ncbi:ilp is an apoptosis inhibitor [Beauveria brongniartii RCEF 3172]|uniref:Ilp is an apoptosis inhibitor n=1 Tax=Beauveria brongniartii RCEF 3172 TaxID=1081107 RepID=A0A162JJQ8_9HYPO|nr:ilp is an apoptosis inhibitor [Beauveria brongniartii RCEF 3172]
MPFQHPFQEAQFDIFDWYPKFRECQSHFIQHAQHTDEVQAVAAFVNILLPFQKAHLPRSDSTAHRLPPSNDDTETSPTPTPTSGGAVVALVPYVRRLVATGFDTPAVLHGFFGDDWAEGVGPMHDMERRNFLFAAKSENWVKVKSSYDVEGGQMVPFLRPLQGATEGEIQSAEASWSEWLAMQDWMLGPRAPSHPVAGG